MNMNNLKCHLNKLFKLWHHAFITAQFVSSSTKTVNFHFLNIPLNIIVLSLQSSIPNPYKAKTADDKVYVCRIS